ncbi:MAG TPA: response regulator transcription factor [Actinomycetota bacterium]
MLVASSSRLDGEAAASLLGSLRGWEVAGPLQDGLEVLGEIRRRPPHAVLILHDLARLGPAPLAGQIRRRWPEVSVVVIGTVEAPHASVLPPSAARDDVLAALAAPPLDAEPVRTPVGAGMERLRTLTPRERDVLKLLGSGATRQEIASALGTSPHTVRTHMHNLYRKLDAHSHLEIVRFAAQHGLIETEPGEKHKG